MNEPTEPPTFQFHKGAIRTWFLRSWRTAPFSFQFQKGAIRTCLLQLVLLLLLHFNSIKVRLEPTSPFANEKVTTFQFHKGAIRTNNYLVSDDKLYIFQFHKGAIRTVIKANIKSICIYFNSIKVRLEPLKRQEPLPVAVFQFHKGAIRTEPGGYCRKFPLNFNSIKVRLELVIACISYCCAWISIP